MTSEIKFECQGIGRGAVCGADATKRMTSYKWNPETQKIDEIVVWICSKHLQELSEMFSDKTVVIESLPTALSLI